MLYIMGGILNVIDFNDMNTNPKQNEYINSLGNLIAFSLTCDETEISKQGCLILG